MRCKRIWRTADKFLFLYLKYAIYSIDFFQIVRNPLLVHSIPSKILNKADNLFLYHFTHEKIQLTKKSNTKKKAPRKRTQKKYFRKTKEKIQKVQSSTESVFGLQRNSLFQFLCPGPRIFGKKNRIEVKYLQRLSCTPLMMKTKFSICFK